jgi:hypothetical protein
MVQDDLRPAILFGFFWVAIRRRKSLSITARSLGKTGLESPKSANPAIKVLWSR